MKRLLLGLAAIGAMMLAAPAAHAMSITEATITQGLLVIQGNTAPNTLVTVDGAFGVMSDSSGNFHFGIASWHPDDCVVKVEAREVNDWRNAVIAKCGEIGPPGETGPQGEPGPRGPAGPPAP